MCTGPLLVSSVFLRKCASGKTKLLAFCSIFKSGEAPYHLKVSNMKIFYYLFKKKFQLYATEIQTWNFIFCVICIGKFCTSLILPFSFFFSCLSLRSPVTSFLNDSSKIGQRMRRITVITCRSIGLRGGLINTNG